MPIPKSLLAGGVAATLAVGGGAVIAHEFIDNPSSAVGSQPTASAHPISANLNARQIYDASKNAVTYIVADTPEGQATGSGFVVSKDGLIVTNDHVVDGASQVQVKIGTSNQAQAATVVGADPSRDLALLKVDASNLPTLSLGRLLVGRRGRPHVRDRQPLRPRPHTDDRDRLGAAAQPPGARRRHHLRRHPDRRRVEPRQLGRPAARLQRQGDRRQLADPDRQLERRGGRQRRHRLRHPRQHRQVVHRRGEGGQAQAADRSAAAAADQPLGPEPGPAGSQRPGPGPGPAGRPQRPGPGPGPAGHPYGQQSDPYGQGQGQQDPYGFGG